MDWRSVVLGLCGSWIAQCAGISVSILLNFGDFVGC